MARELVLEIFCECTYILYILKFHCRCNELNNKIEIIRKHSQFKRSILNSCTTYLKYKRYHQGDFSWFTVLIENVLCHTRGIRVPLYVLILEFSGRLPSGQSTERLASALLHSRPSSPFGQDDSSIEFSPNIALIWKSITYNFVIRATNLLENFSQKLYVVIYLIHVLSKVQSNFVLLK